MSESPDPEPLKKKFKTFKAYGRVSTNTVVTRGLFEEWVKEKEEDNTSIFNVSSSDKQAGPSCEQNVSLDNTVTDSGSELEFAEDKSFNNSEDIFDDVPASVIASVALNTSGPAKRTRLKTKKAVIQSVKRLSGASFFSPIVKLRPQQKQKQVPQMRNEDLSYCRPKDPNAGRVFCSEQSVHWLQKNFLRDLIDDENSSINVLVRDNTDKGIREKQLDDIINNITLPGNENDFLRAIDEYGIYCSTAVSEEEIAADLSNIGDSTNNWETLREQEDENNSNLETSNQSKDETVVEKPRNSNREESLIKTLRKGRKTTLKPSDKREKRKTGNRTIVIEFEEEDGDESENNTIVHSTPLSKNKLIDQFHIRSVRIRLTPLSPMLTLNANLKHMNKYKDLTDEEKVLRFCEQDSIITFEEFFKKNKIRVKHKLAEGTYGEIFLVSDTQGTQYVMKIVPIEGDLFVNGDKQKKYQEMYYELASTKELSNLREGKQSRTSSFVNLKCCGIVKGQFPKILLDAWNKFDKENKSENDNPTIFPPDQLFVLFLLEHGGNSYENFEFENVTTACSACVQVACALAVAEEALSFEHRDLHWANVLIKRTDEEYIEYRLDGKKYRVKSYNLKAIIIDYSYSFIRKDGCVMYQDLADDEDLFNNNQTIQGVVYRDMKESNENNWREFNPYTNILWIRYLFQKLHKNAKFKEPKSKYRSILSEVQDLIKGVTDLNSCSELVQSSDFDIVKSLVEKD